MRCILGTKKLRRAQEILGPGFKVLSGTVRGGEGHGAWVRAEHGLRTYIVRLDYHAGVIKSVEETTPFEVRSKLTDNPGPFIQALMKAKGVSA